MEDYAYYINTYLSYIVFDAYDDPTENGICTQISFFNYLTNLQGEEAALEAVVNNTPTETFGKSWNSLIADWKADMEENFAWVQEITR